jgi:ketosteroid isomerase-like protein
MASPNVELVRRAFAAFNEAFSGSAEGFTSDAFAEFASADLEYVEDPSWPGADTYTGEAGFRKAMKNQFDALGEGAFEPEEIIDAGNDQLLVIVRWRATGTASGAVIEVRVAQVHTIKDGRIARIVIFLDPAAARKSLAHRPAGLGLPPNGE